MDIKDVATSLSEVINTEAAERTKVVAKVAEIIKDVPLSDLSITALLTSLKLSSKVTTASASVMKSQLKKIFSESLTRKDEVLKLCKQSGNLDKLYKAVRGVGKTQSNAPKKTTAPPKAGKSTAKAADEPSEVVNVLDQLVNTLSSMHESGMTGNDIISKCIEEINNLGIRIKLDQFVSNLESMKEVAKKAA